MITFFKKLIKNRREKKILYLAAFALLKSIDGELKKMNHIFQTELSELTKQQMNANNSIIEMVEVLAKYFKIELEFAEKEKAKGELKPTEHDKKF